MTGPVSVTHSPIVDTASSIGECDTYYLLTIVDQPSSMVTTLRATHSRAPALGRVPGHVDRILSQHQGHGLTVCAVMTCRSGGTSTQGKSRLEYQCGTSVLSLARLRAGASDILAGRVVARLERCLPCQSVGGHAVRLGSGHGCG